MSARLEKAAPLIALGAVLIVLAIIFLPGFIRQLTFKRDLNEFIRLVKAGEPERAADFVAPEDHARALDLIASYVPPDYHEDLAALNMRGYEYIDGTNTLTASLSACWSSASPASATGASVRRGCAGGARPAAGDSG